jgi:Protein O-mannosyl-transferase TMEM260-like
LTSKQVAALAVLFFLAHIFFLPPTLEDIDSINFALGVRDFDVAHHQPHPPGYPVFIALGKISTAVLNAAGVPGAASRALGLSSTLAAGLLIPLLVAFYRGVTGDDRVAWWSTLLAVCSPLFWFTALRPLSDMTGLAFAVGAQMLLVRVLNDSAESADSGARWLIAGAALCGFAAGIRVQTIVLTGPLFAAALLWPRAGLTVRHRVGALLAAAVCVLAWAIPLLIANGGLSAYLTALGTQAGEDFSGVVMLWTTRQARVARDALLYSFVWSWGTHWLGMTIVALAALGVVRAAWRAPRVLVILTIAFAPYAVFHLLFQETITVRYALPLIVPTACLVCYAAAGLGRLGLAVTTSVLAAVMLVVTVPATRAFGRDGSPAFRAYELTTGGGASSTVSGPGPNAIGMHAVMRRVVEWERASDAFRVLRAAHGREWLALVAQWRSESDSVVRFFADPRRTDLVLFDSIGRTRDLSMRWTFPEMPFVAGTRPGAVDVYTMRPPGWMLEHGWALTAEIGGVTAKEGLGPQIQPSVAWIRARPERALMIIGGRNLGASGDAAARLTVARDAGSIETWSVPPGYFFRSVELPPGSLAGSGYLPLRVSAVAADGSGRRVPVSLEQFDLQSDGNPMFGYATGWYEPEYSPSTARAWRWMSEHATIWVRPVGRDVTLTLRGESATRYFDKTPTCRITVAGQKVGRFTPSTDFSVGFTLPARLLEQAAGQVIVESDLWFSPKDRGESADPRHLALRMYAVEVR